MNRPVIGITTYVEQATWGAWPDVLAALVPHAYVHHVEQAGGIAVLIPPRADTDEALARELLQRLDGVVITGGVDVAPELYGAQRHPSVQATRVDRDTTETALSALTLALDVPVLGVCRGMQVMAVASGGELEQHVPERVGSDLHSPTGAEYSSHPVTTVGGTQTADVIGAELAGVPSHHHQSVLRHPGYTASAWAPDGTLEAMENSDSRFRIAVQWHPEVSTDGRLFQALVDAARLTAR